MPSYLILTLDPTGRVLAAFDAQCQGETTALAWALSTLETNDGAEVWLAGKCIARVDRRLVALEHDLLDGSEWRQAAAVPHLGWRERARARGANLAGMP